jgi:hypothetical protein
MVVSDAFYSNAPGAFFTDLGFGSVWILPCTQELNATFNFGGKSIPIHPLDMTIEPAAFGVPNSELQTSDGVDACIGAFQPISVDSSTYDIILGMAFLRSAYILINFGDFIDGSNNTADPYIQLLATSNDASKVHSDFVKMRLNGENTTTTSNPSNSINSDLEVDNFTRTHQNTYKIAAFAAAGVLFLLGVCAVAYSWWNKRRSQKGGLGSSYRPLHDPTPTIDSHIVTAGPQAQYDPYKPPQYQTPWNRS